SETALLIITLSSRSIDFRLQHQRVCPRWQIGAETVHIPAYVRLAKVQNHVVRGKGKTLNIEDGNAARDFEQATGCCVRQAGFKPIGSAHDRQTVVVMQPLVKRGVEDVMHEVGDRKSTRLNSSHVKISY